jgi:hypothetical protein
MAGLVAIAGLADRPEGVSSVPAYLLRLASREDIDESSLRIYA